MKHHFTNINLSQLVMHLSSFYIYLVSVIVGYSEEVYYDTENGHPSSTSIFWLNLFRLVTSFVSQMIMIAVFHYLCK